MKIQGSLTAADVQRTIYQPQSSQPQSLSKSEGSAARRFDSVTIRSAEGRQSAYAMELRGKISQEVRTATSSGQVAELREQIRSGVYRPDPSAIAQKMYLLGVTG